MKIFSRVDSLIIVTILLISGICLLVSELADRGNCVQIMVDGREYGNYPLDTDTEIVVEGYNGISDTVAVLNGEVYMKEAKCPDKYCVNQKHISKVGETIVCLPGRIIVSITGNGNSNEEEYDAISN